MQVHLPVAINRPADRARIAARSRRAIRAVEIGTLAGAASFPALRIEGECIHPAGIRNAADCAAHRNRDIARLSPGPAVAAGFVGFACVRMIGVAPATAGGADIQGRPAGRVCQLHRARQREIEGIGLPSDAAAVTVSMIVSARRLVGRRSPREGAQCRLDVPLPFDTFVQANIVRHGQRGDQHGCAQEQNTGYGQRNS